MNGNNIAALLASLVGGAQQQPPLTIPGSPEYIDQTPPLLIPGMPEYPGTRAPIPRMRPQMAPPKPNMRPAIPEQPPLLIPGMPGYPASPRTGG